MNRTVEISVPSEMYGVTTCVVDVVDFINKKGVFPCTSGEDIRLSNEENTKIWKEIWNAPLADKFTEQGLNVDLEPGICVSDRCVDYYRNQFPPRLDWSNLLQVGEPMNHINGKATYMTFTLIDLNRWVFCGDCFAGSSKPVAA